MTAIPQQRLHPPLDVIAIDDEPLALSRLYKLVRDTPGTRLVASTTDPREAQNLVMRHQPDVLLLDINMPGIDGLELANRLTWKDGTRPLVIFVTASNQHAIGAFERRAIDYLLKPVSLLRLQSAFGHARMLIERGRALARIPELEQHLKEARLPAAAARDGAVIWALRGSTFVQVRVGEIERAESERDYVHIHNNERSYLLRTSLAALHQRLGPDRYVRVRRSVIVRLDRISGVRDRGYGNIQVELMSGAMVQVGRTYLKPLRQRLKGWERTGQSDGLPLGAVDAEGE